MNESVCHDESLIMAYDEKPAERVRRVVSGRLDLVEKKMMGGLCFMVSGSMSCGVAGSALPGRCDGLLPNSLAPRCGACSRRAAFGGLGRS